MSSPELFLAFVHPCFDDTIQPALLLELHWRRALVTPPAAESVALPISASSSTGNCVVYSYLLISLLPCFATTVQASQLHIVIVFHSLEAYDEI